MTTPTAIEATASQTIQDRIDAMLLMGATESSDITPVLNERYNEVVFVPSDRLPSLNLSLCSDTNLMIIDHRDYSDIADELDIQDQGEDITRAYFINRIRAGTGYGTAWISREGWAEIFDHMVDGGMTIQGMLKDLPRVANSFQENTPADVLSNLDIDSTGMTMDDITQAATVAIHDNDNMSFIGSYEVDGDVRIAYSES